MRKGKFFTRNNSIIRFSDMIGSLYESKEQRKRISLVTMCNSCLPNSPRRTVYLA